MMTPTDHDDALRRMVRHAVELLSDAETVWRLHPVTGSQGRGAYILKLIGLEILMKANLLRHRGEVRSGHEIEHFFADQPESFRTRVERWFDARYHLEVDESGRHDLSLRGQLHTLGKNFVLYRYSYEGSFPFTAREMAEWEAACVARSGPLEMLPHGALLDRLLGELLCDLHDFLPPRGPRVSWEHEIG